MMEQKEKYHIETTCGDEARIVGANGDAVSADVAHALIDKIKRTIKINKLREDLESLSTTAQWTFLMVSCR